MENSNGDNANEICVVDDDSNEECLTELTDIENRDNETDVVDEYKTEVANIEKQIRYFENIQRHAIQQIKRLKSSKEKLLLQYNQDKITKQLDNSIWIKTFDWSEKIGQILRETFGFKSFKQNQLMAINATLSKRDVLLVMPTGGGKSLVYQLPALLNEHITIVISPLIALIDDQLNALKNLGIEAATLNSSSSREQKKAVHTGMTTKGSKLRLVYVTPEWVAKSKMFMTYLQKCYDLSLLDRIVIDEVHCCSTWGHDFRPDYNYLSLLKNSFPATPVLGLTATASLKVLSDLQTMLCLKDPVFIVGSLNRPNLYYKVMPKPADAIATLEKIVSDKFKDKSGIIYTITIKECEDLADQLGSRGLRVKAYHSQLEAQTKKKIHERWLSNRYQVIIATIAFGMGIDKQDVRFVIHYGVPKSLDGYYQESGRAGRDGKPAECILMYELADYLKIVAMSTSAVQESMAPDVLAYCLEKQRCRREIFTQYFDDKHETVCNQMCDNCRKIPELKYYNITQACKDVIKIIEAASEKGTKLTLNKLMAAWHQKGSKEFRVTSIRKPPCSELHAEQIIAFLLKKGYLKIDKGYTMYTTISYLKRGDNNDITLISMPYSSDLKYPCVSNPAEEGDEDAPPKKRKKSSVIHNFT